MYAPTLKRKQPSQTVQASSSPVKQPSLPFKLNTNSHNHDSFGPMIPSKLLSPPVVSKDKKYLIAPLLVQAHIYPEKVTAILQSSSQMEHRGIGAYKQVNWLFTGNRLIIWNQGQLQCIQENFQQNLTCMSIGEICTPTTPMNFRNKYLVAVGYQNTVKLYTLCSYTLKLTDSKTQYTIKHCLQVDSIKFVESKQLAVSTDTGLVQIISPDSQAIKQVRLPLYKRLLPTTTLSPHPKHTEQLLITKDRIYMLVEQVRQKNWISRTIDQLWDDNYQSICKRRFIEVFQIGQKDITKLCRFSQEDISRRLQSYFVGWNQKIHFLNIYLQKNQEHSELGIVTKEGHFLTLRNSQTIYFAKDPLLLPELTAFTQHSVVSIKTASNQNQGAKKREIVASLGLNSLTLTENELLFVGEGRIDCIRCHQQQGELCLRRQDTLYGPQWCFFTTSTYYSLRQMPLQHFIVAAIHCHLNISTSFQSTRQDPLSRFINKFQKIVSSSYLLQKLIEAVMSSQRIILVNSYILEAVQLQLRGEPTRQFKDWSHQIRPNIKFVQIVITEEIAYKIWNIILELQYRQSSSFQSTTPIYDSSVYWQAIHQLFYPTIQRLLPLKPNQFKPNRQYIEQSYERIKALSNFIAMKQQHQNSIKNKEMEKVTKNTSWLDSTSNTQHQNYFDKNTVQAVIDKSSRPATIHLQQTLDNSLRNLAQFIKVFFSLAEFPTVLPSFLEAITSQHHQKTLRDALVQRQSYSSLIEIDQVLPQLGLRADINYLRWKKAIKMDRVSPGAIDLKEAAEVINSSYFSQIQALFAPRYDLFIRVLQAYIDRLGLMKQSTVQSNTLKQRSLLTSSLFPQDQQNRLTLQRTYFQSQLSKCLQQQKSCLQQAVSCFKLSSPTDASRQGQIMDQIIMISSSKPCLYDYLHGCLAKSGLLRQCLKLQKLKYRECHKFAYNDKIHTQIPVKRTLFPRPTQQK